MTSATKINLIEQHLLTAEAKKRSTFNVSLILGIVLIGVFLGLFVLEFSRILSLTGRVNHAPAALSLNETATTWHRSSSFVNLPTKQAARRQSLRAAGKSSTIHRVPA